MFRTSLIILIALALSAMTLRRTKRLSWTAPTTYTDGSPLTVHHYNLYQKKTSIWEAPFMIPDARTTWTVYGVSGASETWAVTAVDAAGKESEKSNELTVTY